MSECRARHSGQMGCHMITEQDLKYHLRRAREETTLADFALCNEARHAHLELAQTHERRAKIAEARLSSSS